MRGSSKLLLLFSLSKLLSPLRSMNQISSSVTIARVPSHQVMSFNNFLADPEGLDRKKLIFGLDETPNENCGPTSISYNYVK